MSIVRIAKRRRYTNVPMQVVDDTAISPEALGWLVILLSKPDDWEVRQEHLAQWRGASKYAVSKVLRELRDAGYARLVALQNPDGTMAGSAYEITDEPGALADGTAGADSAADTEPAGPPAGAAPALDRPPMNVRDLAAPEQMYADLFGLEVLHGLPMYPRDLLRSMTDEPALRSVLHTWAGNGYKPTSLSSMRDAYRRTLEHRAAPAAGKGRGASKNDLTAQSTAETAELAARLAESIS